MFLSLLGFGGPRTPLPTGHTTDMQECTWWCTQLGSPPHIPLSQPPLSQNLTKNSDENQASFTKHCIVWRKQEKIVHLSLVV